MPRRQLVLNAFFMRFGHHLAAWRHRAQRAGGRPDPDWWIDIARQAEAAKFHTFFVADFIGRGAEGLEQQSRGSQNFQFEPFTLLSLRMVLAALLLGLLAAGLRSTGMPAPRAYADAAVVGLFLHAGYLGGVFFAISRGWISSLPFIWPQRLGNSWSSMLMPTTPASSNSRTTW